MPRDKPAPTFDAWPEHPLFPVEEGEKTPEVAWVQITRIDRGVQAYGPILRADELVSTDELFEMYGGGHYELWARAHSKMHADRPGNITKKKRFVLPGRSKPLSKDPTAEELRQAEGLGRSSEAAAPAPAPAAPMATGAGESVLLALLNMQQQQAQANAESSRQFMALMMSMINDSKKESVAQMQQLSSMMMQFSQSQQQSMITMMTALVQNRGGGPEELAKYAKLLRDLGVSKGSAEGEAEPAGFGKMLEDAADFVQGVVQLKGAMPPAPNGAPSAPPAPGSAAAVVAAEMGGAR